MDTHAIYEGAMRLLAASGKPLDLTNDDIAIAVNYSARVWRASFEEAATRNITRTVSRMPGTPSADAFRSAGAV